MATGMGLSILVLVLAFIKGVCLKLKAVREGEAVEE